MMAQRPETEQSNDLAAALGGPPHLSPYLPQSDSLLDGEKAAAMLLFSGVFLALLGFIFTAMGWQHYLVNPTFEWTQLLGPILISVGGTFMLTSICRFGITSCSSCKQRGEVLMEQTSTGHPFSLSGVNQQVVLCGDATVLHIPPVYNLVNQELSQAIELHRGGSLCCAHNAVFPAEEHGSSGHDTETDCRRSR